MIDRYKGAYPISEDVSYPDLDAGTVLIGVLRAGWSSDPAERPVIGNIVQSLRKSGSDIWGLPSLSSEPLEITSITLPLRAWSAITMLWN